MHLTLTEAEEARLKARAHAQGTTPEALVRQALESILAGVPEAAPAESRRNISKVIREIWRDMPEETRARLPSDSASQIDHYVYGLPKRNQ